MKKYSVALVFSRQKRNVFETKLYHSIIEANSEEEALGIALNECFEDVKGFELGIKSIIEI